MLPTNYRFILAKQFQIRRFLEIDQSKTRIACGSHVCIWIKMSNLYRGSSIDASYQVSYHLAKWLQRKSCFRNRPIRNKNCLWRPCLLIDRDEMSNRYRGPPIDVSYKVSVRLVKQFQRRRFLKIGQSETRIAYGGHVCKWIRTT